MLSVMICIIQLVLGRWYRSEEHTSELQSRSDLVCRLLLEKKKNTNHTTSSHEDNLRAISNPNFIAPTSTQLQSYRGYAPPVLSVEGLTLPALQGSVCMYM